MAIIIFLQVVPLAFPVYTGSFSIFKKILRKKSQGQDVSFSYAILYSEAQKTIKRERGSGMAAEKLGIQRSIGGPRAAYRKWPAYTIQEIRSDFLHHGEIIWKI
ncbi:MAG: hypothetical protein HFH57_06985 [Lachnospiraceae bacterium]|nr:hypothetical protein [Lachnospiraceae bacterium]